MSKYSNIAWVFMVKDDKVICMYNQSSLSDREKETYLTNIYKEVNNLKS